MTSYLDDAGRLLREARDNLSRLPRPKEPQDHMEQAWARMWLAGHFAQLASIEAGLPPQPLPGWQRRAGER